jgi:hypothetical protein
VKDGKRELLSRRNMKEKGSNVKKNACTDIAY